MDAWPYGVGQERFPVSKRRHSPVTSLTVVWSTAAADRYICLIRGIHMELNILNKTEVPPSQNRGTNNIANQEKVVYPRFLVVKRTVEDFSKTSPFVIEKFLNGFCGPPKVVKKIKDGLLIESVSPGQSKKLLSLKKFVDMEVTVSSHKTLNESKGIIYCRDLLNCSTEELEEELKNQGVVKVFRIKTRRDGNLVDTPNHVLTFNNPTPPKTIKVAFYSLDVRLYIPSPLRCFRCQKYGHTSMRCDKPQVCVCGKPIHEGHPCEEPVTCVNCEGNHSARSRECIVYKQECAIQNIKTTRNISYPEARKIVVKDTPTPGISFAQATKKPSIDLANLAKELAPLLLDMITHIIKPLPETPATSPHPILPAEIHPPSTSHLSLTSPAHSPPAPPTQIPLSLPTHPLPLPPVHLQPLSPVHLQPLSTVHLPPPPPVHLPPAPPALKSSCPEPMDSTSATSKRAVSERSPSPSSETSEKTAKEVQKIRKKKTQARMAKR